MSGVRSINLDPVSLVDELIGHRDGSTVRIALARLVALISALLGPAHATRAELLADLDWAEGAQGYVRGDSTPGYNGVYRKTGAAGAGSWARIGDLPSGAVEAARLGEIEAALALRAMIVHSHSVGQIDGLAAELDALIAQLIVVTTALESKAPLASPTFTGTVGGITKAMVGLGSVDNTADAAKPVSTAQQAALNAKAPLASPAFTGTVTGVTKAMVGLGAVDNTTDAAKPVSTAQQAALDAKAPLASPAFTGTVTGVTKAMVGLGAVDNTADAAKPVSTAQQAALDALTLLLTSEETRARAAEALIAARARPGELASAYAPELAGQIGATTPYGYGAVVGDTALGAVLRLTGATHAARRAPQPIEPGRVYQARWVWRRATDPADPAGDTVSVGLVWLTETLDQIAAGATTIWRAAPLTVAMGVQRQTATLSLDVPGTDLIIPAAARYARPWVRCYGTDHATHVATVELIDITEAWTAQTAGTAAGAAVTAEAAARAAADTSLTAQIAGKAPTVHSHSIGQVDGLAAELDALIAQLLVVTGLASAAVTPAALAAVVGGAGAPVDYAGRWYYRGVEAVAALADASGRGGLVLGVDGRLRGAAPLDLAVGNGLSLTDGTDGLWRLGLGIEEGRLPLGGGQEIDTTAPRWFRGRAVALAAADAAGTPGLVVCDDGAVALGDDDLVEPRGPTLYYEGDPVDRAEVDPDGRPWMLRLADGRLRLPGLDGRDLAAHLPAAPPPRIHVYGDSLAEGAGGGGVTWPNVLAGLTGLEVYNFGIGGQTSKQIAMRLGALVPRVTIGGNQIVAGANTITVIDGVTLSGSGGMAADADQPFPLSTAAANATRSATVTIQGVTGTLTRTATGGPPSTAETYMFTPGAGSILPVTCPAQSPMRFAPDIRPGDKVAVPFGRNDNAEPAQILANLRLSVAVIRARDAHPVILTVINGNYAAERAGGASYQRFVDLAADMEREWPVETIDIRRHLISQGLSRAGITPTAQDLTDVADDIVPASLRADNIHLNAAGYTVIAEAVHAHLAARALLPAS